MPDPGWDIPGVDRDASPGGLLTGTSPAAGTSTAAGADGSGSGARPARKGRTTRRDGSVSAASGLSAGAFAPAGDSDSASASPAAGSPAGSPAAGSAGAASSAGSASDGSDGSGSRSADRPYVTAGAGGPYAAGGGARPPDAAQALAWLNAALEFLAADDPARWSEGLQADCLRALAVAESRQTAAHARVLSAFSVPGGGLNGDGHRSPRVWLTWQTRATRPAAGARVAWMRRLDAHPRIAAALAAGTISVSWARQLADWSDRLPEDHRGDADADFLAAAGGGAGLSDLAGLAEDLRRQHAQPDPDDGDGFGDRNVRLDRTFGGAGRLTGDLTPACAQLAETVLDALARARGPEDDRSTGQRRHDALEEAFLRLAGAGTLPRRAGQPVRLELDITLAELLRGDRDGRTCDAAIQPVITGHVDYDLLTRLTRPGQDQDQDQDQQLPYDSNADDAGDTDDTDDNGKPDAAAAAAADDCAGGLDYGLLARLADPDSPQAARLRDAAKAAGTAAAAAGIQDVLATAIRLLSGPGGAAAALRRTTTGIPRASVSLPLDIATAFDTVPVHLRRAVRRRDRCCRFPGCDIPAAACDVHHIVWRSNGGGHTLTNLVLLCHFHHHVAIHRWGWVFTLHSDGTTTAISPDATKTLNSHPPPRAA